VGPVPGNERVLTADEGGELDLSTPLSLKFIYFFLKKKKTNQKKKKKKSENAHNLEKI
jgi:hypothetical protein